MLYGYRIITGYKGNERTIFNYWENHLLLVETRLRPLMRVIQFHNLKLCVAATVFFLHAAFITGIVAVVTIVYITELTHTIMQILNHPCGQPKI